MSNGTIIICGGVGHVQPEKRLWIPHCDVLTVAIRYCTSMAEENHGVSHRDAVRMGDMVNESYDSILKEARRLGLQYIVHAPHEENFRAQERPARV